MLAHLELQKVCAVAFLRTCSPEPLEQLQVWTLTLIRSNVASSQQYPLWSTDSSCSFCIRHSQIVRKGNTKSYGKTISSLLTRLKTRLIPRTGLLMISRGLRYQEGKTVEIPVRLSTSWTNQILDGRPVSLAEQAAFSALYGDWDKLRNRGGAQGLDLLRYALSTRRSWK